MMLFGLSLTLLFYAIAQVESDGGVTSRNVYQLQNIYIDDVNRIYNLNLSYNVKFDKRLSEKTMWLYWKYYGERYTTNTGRPVTYEILARIHYGGPSGYKRFGAQKYWERVRSHLKDNK
jgi:hypothetical protein